jgi:putative hydrolase
VGPQRRGLLEGVQATMGLVEGHAEWAMDAAARDVLPSLDRMRAAMDARRRTRSPTLRLLDKLLGMDMKLRQYQDGRGFCDAIVAAGGTAALDIAWRSPQDAPTLDELRDPGRWLARQGLLAA